jgi:hypothetical protein
MAKSTNLAKVLSVIVFSVVCITASVAQTSYYVDTLYSGGGNNGSAAHPWTSLSSGWSAINSALASGPVTVYFSACNPGCTAPETSTSQISLGSRTDTSANMLTLDGISKYNTNSATPSWATNLIPTPCIGWRCAATAPFATAQKFQVTATTPLEGNDNVNNCLGYFTVQGFTFHNAEGQSADVTYIHDLTVQYNEFKRIGVGSYGPGVIAGPGQHGPCNASTSNVGGPDNVTIQYNWVHETWGECIYIGASTSDPPGGPGNSEYTANGMTCGTACNTGRNYLIQYNTAESCAAWGGQGDGTDVKDGHDNLRVIGNTYRTSLPPSCLSPHSPACTNGAGNDGQGPLFESGTQVIGNYVEAPGHQCTPIYSSWNNAAGRGDMLIANNICVNANSGVGSNVAYNVWSASVPSEWTTVEIYNNTVYKNDDACIEVQSASTTGGTTVKNNICHSTGGGFSGTATHDYNDYYNTTCTSETHGMCVDPLFVSTATPYIDANFKLQAGTPVGSAGIDLSSMFTTDYFGATRTAPWDLSAVSLNTGTPPNPPTALTASVN